jgi:general secretion pathway protein E
MFLPDQCDACNQTGYAGRTAICDILLVDEHLKSDIAESEALLSRLRAEGGTKGRYALYRHGIKKVVAGVTSLDEVKRVVGS